MGLWGLWGRGAANDGSWVDMIVGQSMWFVLAKGSASLLHYRRRLVLVKSLFRNCCAKAVLKLRMPIKIGPLLFNGIVPIVYNDKMLSAMRE